MSQANEMDLLSGLNPFQRAIHRVLWDESDEDGAYSPPRPALIILKSGVKIIGTIVAVDSDGTIQMSPETGDPIGGIIYLDLRELAAIQL